MMNMPMLLSVEEEDTSAVQSAVNTRPIDIVYVLQTEGNAVDILKGSRVVPQYFSMVFSQKYPNMRVCVLESRIDGIYSNGLKDEAYWFKDYKALDDYCYEIEYEQTTAIPYRKDLLMLLGNKMNFREESIKIVVWVPAGQNDVNYTHFQSSMKAMKERGIYYFELHTMDDPYESNNAGMKQAIASTGGRIYNIMSDTEDFYVYLFEARVDEIMNTLVEPQTIFRAVVATGYEEITLLAPLNSESVTDSDYDELSDWEEVNTDLLVWRADGSIGLPTLWECIENYSEDSYVVTGLERFKQSIIYNASGLPTSEYDEFLENALRGTRILPIHSNPVEPDSDSDNVSDIEEWFTGTKRLVWDTDNDGLSDGIEAEQWMDPFTVDGDGDGRTDKEEYLAGTDPYCYNKVWGDYIFDFISGTIIGDFDREPDSAAVVMGQIAGGFYSIADARDVFANLVYEDYTFAALNLVGFAPLLGDVADAAACVGRLVLQNIDELAKSIDLMAFVNKHFPEVTVALGKSDAFIEAVGQISKADEIKLTKTQAKVLTETLDAAGLSRYVMKSSTNLDVKYVKEFSENVWDFPPVIRGNKIDRILNHDTLMGLGTNFPVVDRLENGYLISTKSMDLGLKGYQNPERVKSTLERYAKKLDEFEGKYMNADGEMSWGGKELSKSDYNKKVLEVVLPDTILTEDVVNVLNDFKKSTELSGIQVWYVIGK